MTQRIILFTFFFLAFQAFTLSMFGQPFICTCGYIKLWEGVVISSGNSQHLSDWYTFSHIIHGFLFYYLARFLFPRSPLYIHFLLALGIEISWEIIENTPMVIQHYREQTLARGYAGDSIINSLSDSVAMIIGFWTAWRLPTWAIIIIGISLELWVGYEIRDNLTLNIINLIHAFPAIASWQAGV